MYSLGGVRSGYQRLWDAVVSEVPSLPGTLEWPDDVHATWADDDVVVKQTCGWPLVTRLDRTVRVVGAFEHDVPGAVGHHYRSVIVANRAGGPADFAAAVPGVNAFDSLSGWVSLVAWSGRPEQSLRSRAIESGSHVATLRMLRAGDVELASIDAVTFAHVKRHSPALLTGLEVVGEGPLVPTLPVVVPAADHDLVGPIRSAFESAVTSELLADTCRDLRVTGFAALGIDDYRRDLAPLRELLSA